LGIHAPEFAFEKSPDNVRRAVQNLGIRYAVALDNEYAIWKGFNNRYWPAHYFIDAQGHIRGHHFGEGNYEESEQLLRKLLNEAGVRNLPPSTLMVKSEGVQAAADENDVDSPETYIGQARSENFVSPEKVAIDKAQLYSAVSTLKLNEWALAGQWRIGSEDAVSTSAHARIVFRFHARDLHLVMGPGVDGQAIRFRVSVDGKEPGPDHGVDIDASGYGTVREHRLYQLVRQSEAVRDRTFVIEFLDPGIRTYSFTFG
jgi:hypothetical protein